MNPKLSNTPPPTGLTIVQKLVAAYKVWHEIMPRVPKSSRETLGKRIDVLFLEILETAERSPYLAPDKKALAIGGVIRKLDSLKFMTRLAWEVKAIDNKAYSRVSEPLFEAGRCSADGENR